MSFPSIEPLPDEDPTLTPAQRRLRGRVITPPEGEERAGFVRDLSMLVGPSLEFYLLTLVSGLVLAAGLLLDAPAVFVLAALVAPFLAPLIGTALGAISGQAKFTLQSLGGLLIGGLIIFLCGSLAGWVANFLTRAEYFQAGYHTRLTWPDLLVLALGAGLAGYQFVRAPMQKLLAASAAMAYELYLPLGVAGFGLTTGIAGLWPQGLLIFAIHLLLAVAFGALGLALAGLRPWNRAGFATTGLAALAAVLLLVAGATGSIVPLPRPDGLPALAALPTSSPTIAPTLPPTATIAPSLTPPPPTATPTPTRTSVPTRTPTLTFTPTPIPILAQIQSSALGGALIRENPDYNARVLQSLVNGKEVVVLPERETAGGATWLHVRLEDGREGWIVETLLRTVTPAATGEP